MLDRGHEVAADVAVHHVEPADREQETEQRRGERRCPAAHLGGRKVADGDDEAAPRLAIEPRVVRSASLRHGVARTAYAKSAPACNICRPAAANPRRAAGSIPARSI